MRPLGASLRRAALAAVVVGALLLGGCSTTAGAGPRNAAPPPPTASAGAATPPPVPTVAHRAATVVSAMSVEERAGSVLMTASTEEGLPGLAPLVRRSHLAGVMVRGRSGGGTGVVRRALAPLLRAAPDGLPLLTATDQEGGAVQVLTGPGFARIPSAVEQARRSPSDLQHDATRWARSLARAGIRLDLAPVADVPCATTRDDNPPVADLGRDYGWDAPAAGRHVAAFVRGMDRAGVASTVKHFPGLGCVRANTDTTARVVDTVTSASSPRLRPFRDGIRAGAGFVMVSSAEYTRIDPGTPAVFSSAVIRDLLRRRLGFTGVVMSDDVGGAAAVRRWSPGRRAVRFVAAGGDLLLDIVPSDVPAEQRALVDRARTHPVFAAQLRDAAEHVVAARLHLVD